MDSRVLHLNFSSSGGAGRAATRLVEAQRELGWKTDLLTASNSDLQTSPFENPRHTIAAALDEFVVKDKSFPALFSLARDRLSAINSLPSDYDIYHFHWMNGLLSWSKESFISAKPVVWTLHDMNPFTGGCHYALDCTQYSTGCGTCPAVRKPFRPLVVDMLERKESVYETWTNLQLVAPSMWLAEKINASQILGRFPVQVIPTALDPEFICSEISVNRKHSPATLGKTKFAIIAAQLDSPVKDVEFAVEAFSSARHLNSEIQLILVGSGGKRFSQLPGISITGPLNTAEIISVLDETDYLVVPSRAETQSLVVYEAAARGATPIVRNNTALPEAVKKLEMGFIFDSVAELVSIFSEKGAPKQKDRLTLRDNARAIGRPQVVAEKYAELYGSML